jgi:hypothetical protein
MKKISMLLVLLLAMAMGSHRVFAQSVTVTLMPGWNWISNPTMDTLDFAAVLGSFTPAVGDIIQSQWGSSSYLSNGQWRGNVSQFYPGYGYMYKSNRTMPVMLTFNAQQPAPQVIVTTAEPTDITTNSATCGGNVASSDGDYVSVTLRGICWSTNPNPTFNDNYVEVGNCIGSFTASMTDLSIGTTYYVRAFAVTANGTFYGEEKTFSTRDGIPIVNTSPALNLSVGGCAICGGTITDDGGLEILERGVCWSTSPNPTIDDSHTYDGNGLGVFNSRISGLTSSTTYYVRAYATNEYSTAYGDELSFVTTDIPTGVINGLFTINSNGDQVYFSQGNLQYIGSASTPYYRFSDNQYDMLGAANQSSLDIDLLSTRFQYDWSDIVIENGGNESGIWHVLGMGEWIYLTMQRATSSGIPSTLAKVNNVDGLLVPPDDWDADLYPLSVNLSSSESNVISLDDWNTILEPSGVLFLPCAGGIRDFSGNWGYWDGPGNYWASDGYYPDPPIQQCILFRDGVNSSVHTNNAHVYCRLSVRLVKNYNP